MTTGALSNYLEALVPWLTPPLFSATATEILFATTRMLPPASIAGFECHLGGGEHRVDLSLCLYYPDGRRAVFAGRHPRFPLETWRQDPAVWSNLIAFCSSWADWTSPLYHQIEALWLEFDLETLPDGLPTPAPFPMISIAETMERAEAERRFQTLLSVAVPLLCGRPLSDATLERIAFCRAKLPEVALTRGLGLWLSRPDGGTRLWIADIPSTEAAAYLHAVGWEGDPRTPVELMELGERCGAPVELILDVSAHVSPRVGVRIRRRHDVGPKVWYASVLDAFVQEGRCTPAERDALLGWPGMVPLTRAQDPWAPELDGIAVLSGRNIRTLLSRVVDSFKVSIHPDGRSEVKAYFGYFHIML